MGVFLNRNIRYVDPLNSFGGFQVSDMLILSTPLVALKVIFADVANRLNHHVRPICHHLYSFLLYPFSLPFISFLFPIRPLLCPHSIAAAIGQWGEAIEVEGRQPVGLGDAAYIWGMEGRWHTCNWGGRAGSDACGGPAWVLCSYLCAPAPSRPQCVQERAQRRAPVQPRRLSRPRGARSSAGSSTELRRWPATTTLYSSVPSDALLLLAATLSSTDWDPL